MDNKIDKKVQSVRRVETFEETKKYENRSHLFKKYMNEMKQKAEKPLLKIGKVYIPFSLGTIATAASGSIIGCHDNEISLSEAINIVGKVGAVDAAGALGLVVATISAVSIKEAIKFTYDYMSYPKNKEDLIRLGLYNKTQDALNSLEVKENSNEVNSTKEVSK